MAYTRFDDAFLRFVIMYTKEEKFKRPGEVFVSLDKMTADPAGSCGERTRYGEDGRIYWKESDYINRHPDFIPLDDAIRVDRNIVSTERTMNAISEFRRLLLEYPINVLYAKEHESDRHVSSTRFLATYDSFQALLANRLSSYEGHSLYVNEDEFAVVLGLFQGRVRHQMDEINRVANEVERLKRDKMAYCMYKLFGAFEYKEILEQFPKDEAYAEQGDVSTYLQNAYDVSASFVVRNLLPSLKSLKSEMLR